MEELQADEADRLPDSEVYGQVGSGIFKHHPSNKLLIPSTSTFIFAAQDTTSHALCRLFHLLVLHPDAQSKLREEVIEAKKNRSGAEFDYDTLMNLPYLDAICRETLRLYPPISSLSRV